MQETKLGKFKVTYPDSKEYHILKREIWGEDIYYFESHKADPLIVDIGAHIGLSVLYFKSIYPLSYILAFEPNQTSFEILQENILRNSLERVTPIQKAVWKEKTIKNFYIQSSSNSWSSNSSFSEKGWTGKESMQKITVETTTLHEYIDRDIDMLKIDTEGSELSILRSHKDILKKTRNICVEYHPSKESKPEDILNILKPLFNIQVYHEGKLCKKIDKGKLLTIKGQNSVKY